MGSVGGKRLPRYLRTKVHVPEFARIRVLLLGEEVASRIEEFRNGKIFVDEAAVDQRLSFLYIFMELFCPWRRMWRRCLIPRCRSAVFEIVGAEHRGGHAAVRAKIARNGAPPFKTTDAELNGDGRAANKTPDGLIIDFTVPHQGPML